MVLSIAPVILGDGIRLFGNTKERHALTLRDVKQFDKGLVQLRYTTEQAR
jgi:dihydrofolate reductase